MARNGVYGSFLPLDSLKLGRLVTNPAAPHEDYHDPSTNQLAQAIELSQQRYTNIQHNSSNKDFTSGLTSVVSFNKAKKNIRISAVQSEHSKIYQLQNVRLWFSSAAKDDGTKRWIEDVLEGGDKIYMVVGYQTMRDATLVGEMAQSSATSGQLQLPVVEALTAATGAMISIGGGGGGGGGVSDPGFASQIQANKGSSTQFFAPGEQIFAVQYRRLKFKWYSSKSFEDGKLQDAIWWMVGDQVDSLRGQGVDDDDILWAELTSDDEAPVTPVP